MNRAAYLCGYRLHNGLSHTHIRGGTVSAADLPVWISQLMNVRLPRSGL